MGAVSKKKKNIQTVEALEPPINEANLTEKTGKVSGDAPDSETPSETESKKANTGQTLDPHKQSKRRTG